MPDERTKIQFWAHDLEPALRERGRDGGALNRVAQRDLGRYYAMLKLAMPAFTEGEASLIVDVLNGTMLEPHSAALLWAEVADGIDQDGLAEKWHVDGPALVKRLRALTPFESLAVAEAAERFWSAPTYHQMDLAEGLRAVGLVPGPKASLLRTGEAR